MYNLPSNYKCEPFVTIARHLHGCDIPAKDIVPLLRDIRDEFWKTPYSLRNTAQGVYDMWHECTMKIVHEYLDQQIKRIISPCRYRNGYFYERGK